MKRMLPWLPALCWMGLIFYLSGRTGSQLKSMFPFFKQFDWGHLVAYFILSALFYYALARSTSLKHLPAWTVFLCLLYGISDEFHQSFVPSRSPELGDIINDVLGAVLAVTVLHLYSHKKDRAVNNGKNNHS